MLNKMIALMMLSLLVLSGCSAVSGPADVTGHYASAGDSTTRFEADISVDAIVVEIVSDGAKMLYWKGTFDHKQYPTFTSIADKEVLDSSLMGSSADDKTFSYVNGELAFEFTIMGVTKTVKVKHL